MTRLSRKSFHEKNPQRQIKYLKELDRLIVELQPGVFLFHKAAIDVISGRFRLAGPFELTYEGIHRLRHASLRNK